MWQCPGRRDQLCIPLGPLSRRWLDLSASKRRLQAPHRHGRPIPVHYRGKLRVDAPSTAVGRHEGRSCPQSGMHRDLCSLEALAVSVSSTGPGRKHRRKIQLDPWQVRIVDSYPDQLLRGLIHSDGYRGTNYVNGRGYPRYQFSNRSKDIRGIFCRACDMYGVRWRQMNRWVISVARAPDVAKLDQVIGPKS
jgi:hypothetical protein